MSKKYYISIWISVCICTSVCVEEKRPNGEEDQHHSQTHPFIFGYRIHDGHGNVQSRHELGDHFGHRRGSYGYNDADGNFHKVSFIADDKGFRVHVTRKDSLGDKHQKTFGGGAHVKQYYFMGLGKPSPEQAVDGAHFDDDNGHVPVKPTRTKYLPYLKIPKNLDALKITTKYIPPVKVLPEKYSSEPLAVIPKRRPNYRGPVYKSRYVIKFAQQPDIPRLPRISQPSAVYHYELPVYKDK